MKYVFALPLFFGTFILTLSWAHGGMIVSLLVAVLVTLLFLGMGKK